MGDGGVWLGNNWSFSKVVGTKKSLKFILLILIPLPYHQLLPYLQAHAVNLYHDICEIKVLTLNWAHSSLSVLKIRYQLHYFESVFPLPRAMDSDGNLEQWLAVTSHTSHCPQKKTQCMLYRCSLRKLLLLCEVTAELSGKLANLWRTVSSTS